MKIQNKYLKVAVLSLFPLLIPAIAMPFTNEVNWNFFDFLAGAFLLSGLGASIYAAYNKIKDYRFKWIVIVSAFILFAMVWGELAVGLFGTPLAGN